MMSFIRKRVFRLGRDESGTASVEFMIVFPVYMMVMVMGLELSLMTLRHTMLERGLDMAVRDIRLGTGTAPTHDGIRNRICEEAFTIVDCQANLRLEMVPTDMRNLTGLGSTVQCTDREETGAPVLKFTPGQQNQLMFLRACVKYDPIFPMWEMARAMHRDASGQIGIIAMTAFVQEPL